jgi:nitric oxide reductase subunit B
VNYESQRLARRFLFASALCLLGGATFGLISSLPHAWPAFLLKFDLRITRPVHVTFSIAWIFMAYLGALHYFLPEVVGRDWWSPRLSKAAFWLLSIAGAIAAVSYFAGKFSGREYLDFPLASSVCIAIAYLAILVNWFATVRSFPRPWPVHLWMWSTGLVVFLLTFIEGHLHLIPYYSSNVIRDMSVQWKSYGSLIGSWNHVVYGTAVFLAHRADGRSGYKPVAYLFFWLGLFNLILGFAHHTFVLPQSLLLRYASYGTSMTEWTILAHFLWTWSKRESAESAPHLEVPRMFLRSASVWVGINLCFALLISIPALHATTHGTHTTVAHAMGSTIGINTMILLAAGFGVLLHRRKAAPRGLLPVLAAANVGLLLLLVGLFASGGVKGKAIVGQGWSFYTAVEAARPYLHLMVLGGFILWTALAHLGTVWLRLALSKEEESSPAPARPPMAIPVFVVAAAVGILSTLPWWIPVPEPSHRSLPAGRGRDIFVREGCWKCHAKGSTAVDLATEGAFVSDGWVRTKLRRPDWARGGSVMPTYGHLPAEEIDALVAYVAQLRDARPHVELAVENAPKPAYDATRAASLYASNCASCHGQEGRGNGSAIEFLVKECQPRDFTRGLYRTRSCEVLPTDEDLFRTITKGMPGTAMPPNTHLPPDDRWQLVEYVKRLAWNGLFNCFEKWARDPVHIPEPPEPTSELIARGREYVEAMDCRTCHDASFKGVWRDERGFGWTDEADRPIPRSADLTRGVFKSGSSPKDLYRSIFVGRGGSPMPSYGPLFHTDEKRWAIVHYVMSLREKR